MITIIVPVHNAEEYLSNCLNSVRSQTLSDWTCVLVDDGSIDGSGDICDKFAMADRRFVPVHQSNAGVSVARNAGIDKAEGEFICFLDADDYLEPDFLEMMLSDHVDFVTSGQIRDLPDGKTRILQPSITRDYPIEVTESLSILDLEKKLLLYAVHEKLFRTEIVKKNRLRFQAGCSYGEDLLFTFDYLHYVKKIRQVSYSGYHYRIGTGDTLSTIHRPHQFEEDYFQWNVISAFYRQKGLVTRESEKYHARRLWGIVYDGLFAYPKQEYKKGYIEKILDIPEIESLRYFQDEINCSDWIKKAILRRDKLFFKAFFKFYK